MLIRKEENQDVIDHFLKYRSDFELIRTHSILPDNWVSSRGLCFPFQL